MKYFLDTEFVDDAYNQRIIPISIGIVSEDNRKFYATMDFDYYSLPDWHKENVFPNIIIYDYIALEKGLYKAKTDKIAQGLINFTNLDTNIQFWGWYCAYDWVLVSQLFGSMLGLPRHYPKICYDLKQYMNLIGCKDLRLPVKTRDRHNALEDALWIKSSYEYFMNYLNTYSQELNLPI